MATRKSAPKKAAPKTSSKAKKIPYVTLKSPRVVAAYAHLTKPDTEGRYADNKYKVTLKLKKGVPEHDAFVKKVRDEIDVIAAKQNEMWGTELDAHDPIKDGDQKKEAAEKGTKGYWLLTAKSKEKPKLRDTKKQPLGPKVRVFGGDEIIAIIALGPYKEEVKGKAGAAVYINGAMLVKKNSNGQDVDDMWGDDEFEDGFVDNSDEDGDDESSEGGDADGEEGNADFE